MTRTGTIVMSLLGGFLLVVVVGSTGTVARRASEESSLIRAASLARENEMDDYKSDHVGDLLMMSSHDTDETREQSIGIGESENHYPSNTQSHKQMNFEPQRQLEENRSIQEPHDSMNNANNNGNNRKHQADPMELKSPEAAAKGPLAPESTTTTKSSTKHTKGHLSFLSPGSRASSHGILSARRPYLERESFDAASQEQLCTMMLEGPEVFVGNNLSQIMSIVLRTRDHSMVFSVSDFHKYDHFEELKLSTRKDAHEKTDQGHCLKQLDRLVERARLVLNESSAMVEDMNMFMLLDSYGQPGPGLWFGSTVWPGQYQTCLESHIRDPGRRVPDSRTRYCWAGLRASEAPRGLDSELLMSGLCLPESCDSSNVANKYELISELARLRAPILKRLDMTLERLYCLPDEHSSLRNPNRSLGSLFFIAMVSCWLLAQVYVTFTDSHAANGSGSDSLRAALNIKRNLTSLFQIRASSTNNQQLQEPNFSCIDGIKVISTSYIITGHVIMCIVILIKESRSALREHPSFIMTSQMPAFAVNSFFCITGILTSFQILTLNSSQTFIHEPKKWFMILVVRYLRVMPIYLVMVAYAKYMAKYTGQGPFWDYSTSDLSIRRTCEEESWLPSLLFLANFKHPFDHCIPSAWYLANDFQFFLLAPFLLYLLAKKPQLGRTVLKMSALGSFVANFFSIFLAAPDYDLTPVAKFSPNAFKSYITLLSHNYTQPQYRISAYLIGLLMGHWLFTYIRKEAKIQQQQTTLDKKETDDNNNIQPVVEQTTKESHEPTQFVKTKEQQEEFWWFNWSTWAIFGTIILLPLIPLIGARLPMNKLMARFMISLVMPGYHVIFALSVGGFVLSTATGKTENPLTRFLSLNFWKPLARISLTVVLINIEVIQYLVQSQQYAMDFTNHSMTMFCIYSILSVYMVAIPFSLLFETPSRAIVNILLAKLNSSLKKAMKEKTS